jgi:hypothetical protein
MAASLTCTGGKDEFRCPAIQPWQSICDSIDGYFLTSAQEATVHRVPWCASEKVHGESTCRYNFSINDGTHGFTFTGREEIWDPDADQDHHGWKAMIPTWQHNMEKLAQVIQRLATEVLDPSACPKLSKLALYSEYCGGFFPENPKAWSGGQAAGRYNGDNVCTLPQNLRAIQEGVYYCKERIALAFKLKVYDALPSSDGHSFVLNETPRQLACSLWAKLVKEAGIPTVPFLMKGTFAQVSQFPYENFQSRVPAMLGCDSLPDNTNLAEGIVIEPDEPMMVVERKVYRRWMAADPAIRGRFEDLPRVALIIKLKSKKFKEVDTSAFQEPNMTPLACLLKCASGNRANSVLSKHSNVTRASVDALVQEMADETEEDRMVHFPAAFIPFADQAAARIALEAHCLFLLLQASGLADKTLPDDFSSASSSSSVGSRASAAAAAATSYKSGKTKRK